MRNNQSLSKRFNINKWSPIVTFWAAIITILGFIGTVVIGAEVVHRFWNSRSQLTINTQSITLASPKTSYKKILMDLQELEDDYTNITFNYILNLISNKDKVEVLKSESGLSFAEFKDVESKWIKDLESSIDFYKNPPNKKIKQELILIERKLSKQVAVGDKLTENNLNSVVIKLENLANEYEEYTEWIENGENDENYKNYKKLIKFIEFVKNYQNYQNFIEFFSRLSEVIEAFTETANNNQNNYEAIVNKLNSIKKDIDSNLKDINKKRLVVDVSITNQSITPNIIGQLGILRICCDQQNQIRDYKLEIKSIQRKIEKQTVITLQLESKMIEEFSSDDKKNFIKQLFFNLQQIKEKNYTNPEINLKNSNGKSYLFTLGLEDFKGKTWIDKNINFQLSKERYEIIEKNLPKLTQTE